MRFQVLGPLRASVGDETLALGSPQQQKLLALLLASPNEVLSLDRLIDEMWGDVPPPSARHLVQDYIWRLRSLLGGVGDDQRIERVGSGYMIRVAPEELDALLLAATVDEAAGLSGGETEEAERKLRGLAGIWRGRPFGELCDDSALLQTEAVRLEELYLRAVETRVDVGIELGRHQGLVTELEGLTHQHPYRERFWEQLMLALYRSGRQADALRASHTLREILTEGLGIDVGPNIVELETRILLQDPDLLWEPPAPPSNLPMRLTSFVGRGEEISEVVKLLGISRLITLTGPGGVGKTRLAGEVAERTLFDYPDGLWWVDLAAISDPRMVIVVLADTLGVAAQPDIPLIELVTRSLVHREALLVVDNCEHLAPTVATLMAKILRDVGEVSVLATSRVPLQVPGEVLWSVPALSVPLTDQIGLMEAGLADSVALFVERGTAVERTFSLDEENVDAVVNICQRLDGIPLAIEMSAARLRVLTPAQISVSLDDRFALLTRGEADSDPRHATLSATLDWGYNLLSHELRKVFDRLSVFAGAFDLEAAAEIAVGDDEGSPPLDAISDLVEASMLATVGGPAQVRYRLLETLREYGKQHLQSRGQEDETRESHANHFLGLAEQAVDTIGTPGFASWTVRLAKCYQDVQKALDWSLTHDARSDTLRVAPAMYHFWFRTGDAREAGRWGTRMLEHAKNVPAPLAAAAHQSASFGATILGSPVDAGGHIEEAIRLHRESGDNRGLVTALFGKGNIALRVGDLETAKECCSEALAICDRIQDRWGRAGPLSLLSLVSFFGAGSLDEARRLAEEAMSLYRELGDTGSLIVMNPLSGIAMKQGDLGAAQKFALDTAALASGTGWEATALVNLAEVLLEKGDLVGAEATLKRGVVRAMDTGLENWFRIGLRDLARVHILKEDPQRAALLLGASRRNMPQYGLDPAIYESVESECLRLLGESACGEAEEEGLQMDHERLLHLLESA